MACQSVDQLTKDLAVESEQITSLQNQISLLENTEDIDAELCNRLLLRIEVSESDEDLSVV